MATAGFYGLLDFVGYPVALGAARTGRGFRGAGRHLIHAMIDEDMQWQAHSERRRKRQREMDQARVKMQRKHWEMEKHHQHKQMVMAAYTTLLVEL